MLSRPALIAFCLFVCTAATSAAPPAGPVAARVDDASYVEALHRRLLGRDPRPDELTAELQALARAPYRIVVHNRVLDSVEFRGRVDDTTYLVGLYMQVRRREPGLHELTIGRAFLDDGVPRSELLGALVQPRFGTSRVSLRQARRYDTLTLDFRPARLEDYRARAASLTAAAVAAPAEGLLQEAAELGGLLPGAPDPWDVDESLGPDPQFHVYYGYLHAHTRVSFDAQQQGSPGPFEAYRYARDVAGMDFLGLSDHGEFISTWPWNNEWALLGLASNLMTRDGSFVALRGFEYSNPIYGHINVFGTDEFTSTFARLTQAQFYEWLADWPQAVATYNHPGAVDWAGVEFEHFAFYPAVRPQMAGIELLTHNDDYAMYSAGYVPDDGLGHLDEALARGWRIASFSAQDNHSGGWGTIDDYRTGVLATELTPEALLEAMRSRRVFSTQDRNLTLSFRARGREMGSVLRGAATTFTVGLGDADGEGFARIDFYGNGILLESRAIAGSGSHEFSVGAPPMRSWYYVVVTQDDGDQAMSAPIGVLGPGPF